MKIGKIIAGLVVLIIIYVSVMFFTFEQSYYSANPTTYFDNGKIDTDIGSMGQVSDDGTSYTIDFNGNTRVVLQEGYYKGTYFVDYALEEGVKSLEITPNLNPTDGIPQVYMLERIANANHEVLIFVDKDWRKMMPQTNIIWGNDYSLSTSYQYQEIKDGVYMTIIVDDVSRFSNNYKVATSAILVGDITQDEVLDGVTEGKTVIIFQ